MKKRTLTILFFIAVLIVSAFALADALGVYNSKGYTEVSHGSHIHYVPTQRDPDVGLSRFPMQEPGPDEMITPTGQIVKKTDPND
jgi:hypothetical protein